jgi:hypothetical protein
MILLLLGLFALWAYLVSEHGRLTGHSMPSRRSMRGRRKVARDLGIPAESLEYDHQVKPSEDPTSTPGFKTLETVCLVVGLAIWGLLLFG